MVLIHAGRHRVVRSRRRTRGPANAVCVATALGVVGWICLTLSRRPTTTTNHTRGGSLVDGQPPPPPLHVSVGIENDAAGETAEYFDAAAADILHTLACHELLAMHEPQYTKSGAVVYGGDGGVVAAAFREGEEEGERRRRRRLEGEEAGAEESNTDDKGDAAFQGFGGNDVDDTLGPLDDDDPHMNASVTAKHLFCLAAFPVQTSGAIPEDMDETLFWKDKVSCTGLFSNDKKQRLLDLWISARAEIPEKDLLLKTLGLAIEQTRMLVDRDVHVWAPSRDDGTEYMMKFVNEQVELARNDEYGGIASLYENLGHGRLYVDVGAGLGYTAMAVAMLYPGTEIVGIEAAPTNWLMQKMNWVCNDFDSQTTEPTVLLTGVGPSTRTTSMAKFMWRPTSTTSTRAWSLALEGEHKDQPTENDLELTVKLKPWHAILTEAEIKERKIDVLNVDCEGCEYNVIPSLSDDEFDVISSVVGQMHWGYIPKHKLPSSKRGRTTHERLCRHEHICRASIECCAFPDLTVHSSVSGEILVRDSDPPKFPPEHVTVHDLAEDLCNAFDSWAVEHNLNSVDSDYGWYDVSG